MCKMQSLFTIHTSAYTQDARLCNAVSGGAVRSVATVHLRLLYSTAHAGHRDQIRTGATSVNPGETSARWYAPDVSCAVVMLRHNVESKVARRLFSYRLLNAPPVARVHCDVYTSTNKAHFYTLHASCALILLVRCSNTGRFRKNLASPVPTTALQELFRLQHLSKRVAVNGRILRKPFYNI